MNSSSVSDRVCSLEMNVGLVERLMSQERHLQAVVQDVVSLKGVVERLMAQQIQLQNVVQDVVQDVTSTKGAGEKMVAQERQLQDVIKDVTYIKSTMVNNGTHAQVLRTAAKEQPRSETALSVLETEATNSTSNPSQNAMPGQDDDTQYATFTPFSIDESVWDAPIIAFTKDLRGISAMYLSLLTVAVIILQGYLCLLLLTTEAFMYARVFHDVLPDTNRWRAEDGHHVRNLGSAQMSLTTRVCHHDVSLSIASLQASMLSDVNQFLNLDVEQMDLEDTAVASGPKLCMLCISMFALIVTAEIRRATLTAVSLKMLPRGTTQVTAEGIISMSYSRLACCFFICFIRIVIACVLMCSGVSWLSRTSSIEDLMLNAAGLGFVMDFDEMVFATMIPESTIELVKNFEPLRLPKKIMCIDGILPLSILCSVIIVAYTQLVVPNIGDMLIFKEAMCGGNLNFVMKSRIDLNMIWSRGANEWKEPSSQSLSLGERAAYELEHTASDVWIWNMENRDKTAQLSLSFASQWHVFDSWVTKPVGDISKAINYNCLDWDILAGAGAWFSGVHETMKSIFGPYDPDKQFKCGDFADYCHLEVNSVLRLICPKTCGCDDAKSGLYRSGYNAGCPRSCEILANNMVKSSQCADVTLQSSSEKAQWIRYWEEFVLAEKPLAGAAWGDTQDTSVERIKAEGCSHAFEVAGQLAGSWMPCTQTEHMIELGKASILGFCPATCCKSADAWPGCPTSCTLQSD